MTAQVIPYVPSAIESIMSCENLPSLSEGMLRPIAELLEADSAVYFRFRHNNAKQLFVCESAYNGANPESVDAYVSGFYNEDPLINYMERDSHAGSPMNYQLSNQVRPGTLRRSNYFRNFLKPHELGDILGVAMPFDCDGPQLLCLGLHRQEGRKSFGKPQRLALETVMRPVRLVLEALCMRSMLAEQSAAIQQIENSHKGLEYVVVDEHLRVLRGSGIVLSQLTASAFDSEALSSIRSGIHQISGAEVSSRSYTDVMLPDGRSGRLTAIACGTPRSFILVPKDPGRRTPPKLLREIVQPGEKLTDREQQVIDQLAAGSSNSSIAGALNISVRTVENHLRSIYEKLGINSRTQLISALFVH